MYASTPRELRGWDYPTRRDVGFSWSSLLPVLKPVVSLLPVPGAGVVSSLVPTGGGSSSGSGRYWANTPNKPGDPPAANVVAAMQNAPPDLVAQFVAELAAANNGEKLSPSDLTNLAYAPYWIAAALGGNDRVASTTHGKNANNLLFEILKYVGGNDQYIYASGAGGGQSSTSVSTQQPSTGGFDFGQIVHDVLSSAGHAAASAAGSTLYNSLPNQTQHDIAVQVANDRLGSVPAWVKPAVYIGGGLAVAKLLKVI